MDTANSLSTLNAQTVCDDNGCYEPTNLNNNTNAGPANGSDFKSLLGMLAMLFLIYAILTAFGRNVKKNLPMKPERHNHISREKDSTM